MRRIFLVSLFLLGAVNLMQALSFNSEKEQQEYYARRDAEYKDFKVSYDTYKVDLQKQLDAGSITNEEMRNYLQNWVTILNANRAPWEKFSVGLEETIIE